jgi:uncharacterized protein YjbI with pentapeptide repeats
MLINYNSYKYCDFDFIVQGDKVVNEKHLDIIGKGVTAWNEWRELNPEIKPDLREADLRGKNLSRADLSDAILSNASLIGADLTTSNLSNANLSGADLSWVFLIGADISYAKLGEIILNNANLSNANLIGADLRMAKFVGANLSEADLSRCDLSRSNLSNADLKGCNLSQANLSKADLSNANLIEEAKLCESDLSYAILINANLIGADLGRAILIGANLTGANLSKADLSNANLSGADLSKADLSEANLNCANLDNAILKDVILTNAILVSTNFENANLIGSHVYGISAWNLNLKGAEQSDLVITPLNEPVITVDNLEVAQFIYLMLHNEKIRDIINTIGKKGVLILGRFTPADRKEVLDAIREKLRQKDYVPIVFDFERPTDRDFTETIKTLAGMCRFIIADITNPKSSPLELQAIVPDYMIPLVPIIQGNEDPFSMFENLLKYEWVIKKPLKYDSVSDLIEVFEEAVINPALEKQAELTEIKAIKMTTRNTKDYMKKPLLPTLS